MATDSVTVAFMFQLDWISNLAEMLQRPSAQGLRALCCSKSESVMGQEKAVVTTRFSEEGQRRPFGKLKLYPGQIVLSWIGLKGTERDAIALSDIADVEWLAGAPGESSIVIKMKSGTERQLIVKEGGLLRFEIMRLAQLSAGKSKLPETKRKMSSAA